MKIKKTHGVNCWRSHHECAIEEIYRLRMVVSGYERRARSRSNDHDTSEAGAEAVKYRANSQKMLLLREFEDHKYGMTAEEAASAAGLLKSCYWKRCSELCRAGLIYETDERRDGAAGVPRIVYKITAQGAYLLTGLA